MPCHFRAPAALCRGLEKSHSERHGRGMARAQHGRGMPYVNQTEPHCINRIGKKHSKLLSARNDSGTALVRLGNGLARVN
jgi:hypothetical protein